MPRILPEKIPVLIFTLVTIVCVTVTGERDTPVITCRVLHPQNDEVHLMSETTTTATLPLVAGTWTCDTAHSGIHFKVRHLGLTNVRGRFDDFDPPLTGGDPLEDVAVSATAALSSVDTNQPDRDNHLRSTDFFGVEGNPTLEFHSTRITRGGGGDKRTGGR